jgi:flagellin
VPISSTAGYVAGLINTNAKSLGIRASAKTIVKLSPVSSDGNMSFTLKGKAGTNSSVSISADIVTTDMTNLATSINNFSGRTGVTAYLSNDKEYIILENDAGDDIEISNFNGTGSGGTFTILKEDYSSTGQSAHLTSGSNPFARLSGELRLESSSNWSKYCQCKYRRLQKTRCCAC